jgi:hypothetical protein
MIVAYSRHDTYDELVYGHMVLENITYNSNISIETHNFKSKDVSNNKIFLCRSKYLNKRFYIYNIDQSMLFILFTSSEVIDFVVIRNTSTRCYFVVHQTKSIEY